MSIAWLFAGVSVVAAVVSFFGMLSSIKSNRRVHADRPIVSVTVARGGAGGVCGRDGEDGESVLL